MTVKEAIQTRRAYRSLDKIKIEKELIEDLARSAQLAPSCFNKQPWQFVFVYEKYALNKLFEAMSRGKEWTYDASMIIAVVSKKDLDCVLKRRVYYSFDTGMATAFVLLRATELGYVAPGYNESSVKDILDIPDDMKVLTLIIVGKHSDEIKSALSEDQKRAERVRPERKNLREFAFINKYGYKING